MRFMQVLTEAINSLKFYRRRTTVTIASLAWGVASFVILISYGNGFDTALRDSFTAIGQDLILTSNGQTSQQAGGLKAGRRIRMERDDINEIREAVPLVARISPELFFGRMPVQLGNREKEYTVRSVFAEYEQIRNMTLGSGRWLNTTDGMQRNRVAVLGGTVARELFTGIPPVGEEITLRGIRFQVIGVLETKAQLANYSTPDNRCIFIPYETMSLYRDIKYPDLFVWSPVSGAHRQQAIRQVRATLAGIHNFSPTDEKAVEILAFNQFMYIIDGMSLALRLLLGFVGALTLGIGGVGLANIMLATVLERTREIGVLKALGGKRTTILGQFLTEALLIIGIGGVIGIALGAAVTHAVGSMPLFGELFREQGAQDKGNLELTVSASAVIVSSAVLCLVGLVAGMIPAIKAARLDPIEALRYE